jgi:hypothetical protein
MYGQMLAESIFFSFFLYFIRRYTPSVAKQIIQLTNIYIYTHTHISADRCVLAIEVVGLGSALAGIAGSNPAGGRSVSF